MFDLSHIIKIANEIDPMKRNILNLLECFFDPLDNILSTEYLNKWHQFIDKLYSLKCITGKTIGEVKLTLPPRLGSKDYDAILSEYIKEGFLEDANSETYVTNCHYLLHHLAVTDDQSTTKI